MENHEEWVGLLDRTVHALEEQAVVPLSPGQVAIEGQQLCAGAMLVKEALACDGRVEDARRFRQEVASRNTDYIKEVASTIGLNSDIVQAAIIFNDSLPPEERLPGLKGFFAGLKAGIRAQTDRGPS
ncbi:MAG: hypothetical protein IH999_10105 [Proteobacteria bacterium]|nr:hypothetical protein [Pseudomonadota bacterium]